MKGPRPDSGTIIAELRRQREIEEDAWTRFWNMVGEGPKPPEVEPIILAEAACFNSMLEEIGKCRAMVVETMGKLELQQRNELRTWDKREELEQVTRVKARLEREVKDDERENDTKSKSDRARILNKFRIRKGHLDEMLGAGRG